MPIERLWCGDAGLQLFGATVKESNTPGRPSVLYCPGIAATDIGGTSDRVLQDGAERLSFYCRTEVIGFNPHGIGESDGTLSPASLIEDIRHIVTFLAPRQLVLLGFGLVGYAMLTHGCTPSVVGVVTVDPLADLLSRDQLQTLGVRIDDDSPFPTEPQPVPDCADFARWLLIIPGDKDRNDTLEISELVGRHQPEVHRIFATSTRLHNDPRPYALILGWLERELWSSVSPDDKSSQLDTRLSQ